MRPGIRLVLVLTSLGMGSTTQAQDSSCVTVRARVSQRSIASALVRMAGDGVPAREAWTNATGRVCWPLGSDTQLAALSHPHPTTPWPQAAAALELRPRSRMTPGS